VATAAGKIPLSRVYQSETIDRRILEVVRGGNYILGPESKAFEKELAAYFGVKHVVLSSSWTAAVHLLHLSQTMTGKLKAGDEVLVPSLTAFPSIEPMIHVGVRPVFCDIDDTYTIDPEDARRRITPRTKGILPVHLYGRPANLDAIMRLAREHGLWVIEDCAQSHGARYRGKRAGSFTEHAAFSFYPSKNLTVYGDGGAIATQDDETARLVTMLRNHGRKDKYLHEKVGFNLRFNEIQAAVGREQLKVLDDLNANRRKAADWYRRELTGVKGLVLPPDDKPGETESVYHMFVIRLSNHDTREGLGKALKEQGIETGVHYPVPNHQQPAIADLYGQEVSLPKTEDYTKRILSLPMHPMLTEDEVRRVATAVKAYLKH
jgi:dTDP-4-amino-4,6-dideoxygalactose transaminase